MKVDLTKKDLISLIKGTNPHYNVMDNNLVKLCGRYIGGFRDEWKWNCSFNDDLTEDQLWNLYVLCRNSWD